ncbi:MAG: hypothetical protein HYU36_25235 [Planctomycetes bacterium]|nr:hypothetical protein [Planctomycetota bacterium]
MVQKDSIVRSRGEWPEAFAAFRRSWQSFPLFCVAFAGMYLLPIQWGSTTRYVAANSEAVSRLSPDPAPEIESAMDPAEGNVEEFLAVVRQEHSARSAEPAGLPSLSSSSSGGKSHVWIDDARPDIPRPVRSKLLVSKVRLGGIHAAFQVYECWGSFTGLLACLREDFRLAGWRQSVQLEALAGREMPGVLLAYDQGPARCLMHVARLPASGKVEVLLLYVEGPVSNPGGVRASNGPDGGER